MMHHQQPTLTCFSMNTETVRKGPGRHVCAISHLLYFSERSYSSSWGKCPACRPARRLLLLLAWLPRLDAAAIGFAQKKRSFRERLSNVPTEEHKRDGGAAPHLNGSRALERSGSRRMQSSPDRKLQPRRTSPEFSARENLALKTAFGIESLL